MKHLIVPIYIVLLLAFVALWDRVTIPVPHTLFPWCDGPRFQVPEGMQGESHAMPYMYGIDDEKYTHHVYGFSLECYGTWIRSFK